MIKLTSKYRIGVLTTRKLNNQMMIMVEMTTILGASKKRQSLNNHIKKKQAFNNMLMRMKTVLMISMKLNLLLRK